MNAYLAFAFTAGAVATVNPCGFAMLPAYFARQLGEDSGDDEQIALSFLRVIRSGIGVTIGFVLVFGAASGAMALGASWLGSALPLVGFSLGIVLTLAGLVTLADLHFAWLPAIKVCRTVDNRHGSLMFGIGFGAVSLSCTLPIFLAAVGVATTGNLLTSTVNLFAYAAGMGTVLTMLGLVAASTRQGMGSGSPRITYLLRRLSGLLILLAGIYITFYWGIAIFGDPLADGSNLLMTGERISGLLRGWLGSGFGQEIIVISFAFILATGFGLLLVRSRSSANARHTEIER